MTVASREFINGIFQPHVELATDLLGMVKSKDTGDPTYRYEIAALTIFLAGVDKALSLTCQLLYLANKVTWKWLTQGMPEAELQPGVIETRRGLTTKLNMLQSLGLDLTGMQWIVDFRNTYIHSCSITAGYRITPNHVRSRIILKASGPTVSSSGPPLLGFDPAQMQSYAADLTNSLASFLDATNWQAEWSLLEKQLGKLPLDPEPEFSQITERRKSLDEIGRVITTLNERYIGLGLCRLREQHRQK